MFPHHMQNRYVLQVNGLRDVHDENFFFTVMEEHDIMHVWIARDSHTHEYKGYGFLEFPDAPRMERGMSAVKQHIPYARVQIV